MTLSTSRLLTPALLLTSVLVLSSSSQAGELNGPALAAKAQGILRDNCLRCHGTGRGRGGFNNAADLKKLVADRRVVPGNPTESDLFSRVNEGSMPPGGSLDTSDIALLKKWIELGAPTDTKVVLVKRKPAPETPAPAIEEDKEPVKPLPAEGGRAFIGKAKVIQAIYNDLRKVKGVDRPFIRYFTLEHLWNAGVKDEDLNVYRLALSKLVNSLSWEKTIVNPKAVDPQQTVFRIDLRSYKWSPEIWNRILTENPYGVRHGDAKSRAIYAATKSDLPYIRGDWFVFAASKPPLYHEVLQLPTTDTELEKTLGVDVEANIKNLKVARAGFNGSEVSQHNRLIERHESVYGAYWKSYDFSSSTGRKNIFLKPLGPGISKNQFQHDGGEIIFNLPNGLQAYLLVTSAGKRLDKGPTNIVTDPERPDRAVENGISCMSCHTQGMKVKLDQIRLHVDRNSTAFQRDAADIKSLFPEESEFKSLLEQDKQRYETALRATGGDSKVADPVAKVASMFEQELDLTSAAAEASLPVKTFQSRISQDPALARALGELNLPGGKVNRETWVDKFGPMVNRLRLGSHFQPIEEVHTLKGNTRSIVASTVAPDNKIVLTADAKDNAIKIWDVENEKEVGALKGHTAALVCLVYSADGRYAVSGGEDKTVRVWELATRKELVKFTGHTDTVFSVAIAGDNRKVLSGSKDGTTRLWDIGTGKEVRQLDTKSKVASVALAPDGSKALAGCTDGSIRVWDPATGKEVRQLTGHSGTVRALVYDAEGFRALSGGADGTMRLWDVASGNLLQRFQKDGEGPIWSVALSPTGRRVVAGGNTLTVWDVASGRELPSVKGENGLVFSVVFSTDGRRIISGGQDKVLHVWATSK